MPRGIACRGYRRRKSGLAPSLARAASSVAFLRPCAPSLVPLCPTGGISWLGRPSVATAIGGGLRGFGRGLAIALEKVKRTTA